MTQTPLWKLVNELSGFNCKFIMLSCYQFNQQHHQYYQSFMNDSTFLGLLIVCWSHSYNYFNLNHAILNLIGYKTCFHHNINTSKENEIIGMVDYRGSFLALQMLQSPSDVKQRIQKTINNTRTDFCRGLSLIFPLFLYLPLPDFLKCPAGCPK